VTQPAVQIALLALAVVILIGNTLIVVAFLRGRRGKEDSTRKREGDALAELHERVQELRHKGE
jgi:hypothetical protein